MLTTSSKPDAATPVIVGPVEGTTEISRGAYPWVPSKAENRKKHIVLMTDRYSNLTRALPKMKMTATDVAQIFIYW